jgi:hypothetical protein
MANANYSLEEIMQDKHIESLINESNSAAETLLKAAQEGEHNVDLPALAQKASELIGQLRHATAQQYEQVVALREFAEQVATMCIWEHDDDEGNSYNECDEPDDGYGDSHSALMATIEQSRTLLSKKLPELRTVSALVDQVQRTAVSAINSGQSVVIDRMLPSVAIYHGPDQEFFFQEHEAKKLLDDAEVAVEGLVQETHQVLVVEDYLLFLSQSW